MSGLDAGKYLLRCERFTAYHSIPSYVALTARGALPEGEVCLRISSAPTSATITTVTGTRL
jgi:hypothetical protein